MAHGVILVTKGRLMRHFSSDKKETFLDIISKARANRAPKSKARGFESHPLRQSLIKLNTCKNTAFLAIRASPQYTRNIINNINSGQKRDILKRRQMDTQILKALRNMAWSRAKGEIDAMMQTYYDGDVYEEFDKLWREFVKEVEDRGLWE